jgi:hypothetical protein
LPLDPDAQTYLAVADNLSLDLFWGGLREPLWSILLSVPVAVLGPRSTLIRVAGLSAHVVLVATMQFVATRMFGRGWGAVCGVAVAASPWLLFQAPRGLREEAAAAGVIGIVWMATNLRPAQSRSVVATLAAVGVLALLRWDTLLLTVPITLGTIIIRRIHWRHLATGTVLAGLIVSPLLLGNAAKYGDPLIHANIAAVFFRNLEFAGQPGLPSVEEFQEDAFAGPPETLAHYLLARHSPGELVLMTTRGAALTGTRNTTIGILYPDYLSPQLPTLRILGSMQAIVAWTFFLLAVAGGLVLLVRGPWQWGLLLALSVLQHAPIATLMDPRLALTVYPVAVIAATATIHAAVDGRSSPPPQPNGDPPPSAKTKTTDQSRSSQ